MVDFDDLEGPQKRAALTHDRNYHLTAGAGSGKTTTFAARYVQLLDRADTDPESIAAITFTETGSMELQERVREQVTDRLDGLDEAAYDEWRAHLDALPEAYIHTIHGFCARLLREYALTADVSIGFDIVEETAATIQKRRAVETFLDDNEDDERVMRLADQLYRSRFEDLLVDLLDEHHEVRQWADEWGDTDPSDYVEFVASRFMTLDPAVAQDVLQNTEVRAALEQIQTVAGTESSFRQSGIVPDIDAAIARHDVLHTDPTPATAYDAVVDICDALTTGDGTPYYGSFDSGTYSGYGDWSDESGELYSAATATLADAFDIEAWVTGTRFGVEQNASRYYGTLASVFQDVHDHYEDRKQAEGVLDFSDLIEAAIALLRENPGICASLREQFDQLMLDEVQDTDPRQWELVELLTSADAPYDGLNVFVVGDEKQSIFRFRGADVAQFAAERARLEAANDGVELPPLEEIYPVDGDDDLATNFRTLPAVLEPINELFGGLFGEIPEAYADPPTGISAETSFEPRPQRLAPARTDDESLSTGTDFVLVPEDEDVRATLFDESHPLAGMPDDGAELDAMALAAEVSDLLSGTTQRYEEHTTGDGERAERPTGLGPSDVAILLRKRTDLEAYERALAEFEVPYTVASGIGFYETTEIRALRNLVHVLSDPTDGLSLYAVLRSPIFGFEDRAIVREWESLDGDAVGDGALWDALATSDNPDLRLARERLADWRRRAGVTGEETVVDSWDSLLGQILDETGFIASLATDERGQQAIANVEKFRERLRALSDEGIQTLPVLVDRLEREVEQSGREGDAEVPEEADGVRIMTVHDAKGREFPAVFVPGLSKGFNWQTSYADSTVEFETLTLDGEDRPLVGLKGPAVGDGFDTADTVLKQRLKFARKRELVAEEKRILYVAATRARDHLTLLGTVSTDDGDIATLDRGDADDPSSWFDFVGPAALDDDISDSLAANGQVTTLDSNGHSMTVRFPVAGVDYDRPEPVSPPSLDIEVPRPDLEREFSVSASYLGSLLEDGAPGDVVVDHTGQYVSYYPPDDAPSKEDDSDETSDEGDTSSDEWFPRNVFGDIVHRAAELRLDPTDTDGIRGLAEQYATDRDVPLSLLDADTIEELRTHVRTAVDFLGDVTADAETTADEIRVQAELEHGEVHGDIDHLSVTDSAYHIVDYKTNRLSTSAAIDEKVDHYRWQMLAYAIALHQTDPTRDVRATLLFTDLDEPRTLSWSPDDLETEADRLSLLMADKLGVPVNSD